LIFSMDFSNLPPALVSQLMGMVEEYVLGCRKKFLPQASPLQPSQISELQPFFPAEVLGSLRTLVLRGKRIPNPSFYGMARMMGYHNLPDFADMTAITFVDVVVSHEEFTGDMLFHEAVHAVQYAQLGTKEFATRYVKGFIQGGCHEEIPLEKNAYELESRFSQDKAQIFSVADEVRRWIEAGKL
jgi:hypothetical protein